MGAPRSGPRPPTLLACRPAIPKDQEGLDPQAPKAPAPRPPWTVAGAPRGGSPLQASSAQPHSLLATAPPPFRAVVPGADNTDMQTGVRWGGLQIGVGFRQPLSRFSSDLLQVEVTHGLEQGAGPSRSAAPSAVEEHSSSSGRSPINYNALSSHINLSEVITDTSLMTWDGQEDSEAERPGEARSTSGPSQTGSSPDQEQGTDPSGGAAPASGGRLSISSGPDSTRTKDGDSLDLGRGRAGPGKAPLLAVDLQLSPTTTENSDTLEQGARPSRRAAPLKKRVDPNTPNSYSGSTRPASSTSTTSRDFLNASFMSEEQDQESKVYSAPRATRGEGGPRGVHHGRGGPGGLGYRGTRRGKVGTSLASPTESSTSLPTSPSSSSIWVLGLPPKASRYCPKHSSLLCYQ